MGAGGGGCFCLCFFAPTTYLVYPSPFGGSKDVREGKRGAEVGFQRGGCESAYRWLEKVVGRQCLAGTKRLGCRWGQLAGLTITAPKRQSDAPTKRGVTPLPSSARGATQHHPFFAPHPLHLR